MAFHLSGGRGNKQGCKQQLVFWGSDPMLPRNQKGDSVAVQRKTLLCGRKKRKLVCCATLRQGLAKTARFCCVRSVVTIKAKARPESMFYPPPPETPVNDVFGRNVFRFAQKQDSTQQQSLCGRDLQLSAGSDDVLMRSDDDSSCRSRCSDTRGKRSYPATQSRLGNKRLILADVTENYQGGWNCLRKQEFLHKKSETTQWVFWLSISSAISRLVMSLVDLSVKYDDRREKELKEV